METAIVRLNGEFTAEDLDDIIRTLAQRRASMSPPVPADLTDDLTVLEQPDTLFTIRSRAGGGLRIWLRHDGLGWLPFSLTPAQRTRLRAWLDSQPTGGETFH